MIKGNPAVKRLLADRIGLDPSSVGEGLISRGVQARMVALGCQDFAVYERLLIDSTEEAQALVEEVVIPESWFFRDARPFEALADHARTGWALEPARPPLKALSIPCAGGEEPYSIAMTLLDAGLNIERFRVDAVDVSERSLARAIAGVYGSNSFRGETLAARRRHFREERGRFTVEPGIRSTVRFHLGNLLDASLFQGQPPYDVIFCRNVLIYLDPPARARAFRTLDRLAIEGGLLFLGHADRVEDASESVFAPLTDKGSFAHRKGKPLPVPSIDRNRSANPRPKPAAIPVQAVATPAAPIVKKPVVEPSEPTGVLLDRGSELADLGRYAEASTLVERALSRGVSSARAHFLLGLIRQASGDREAAETQFLKAIYLDAQHDQALLALAGLSHRKGDVAAEAGYRRRASRVAARKGTS